MKKLTLFILAALLISLPARTMASTGDPNPGECVAKPWTFARQQTDHEFAVIFSKMKRDVLFQNYVNELTHLNKQNAELARKMSHYLFDTEQDQDWKGFYGTLAYAADLDGMDGGPESVEIKEICKFEKQVVDFKAHGGAPLSKKSVRRKSR